MSANIKIPVDLLDALDSALNGDGDLTAAARAITTSHAHGTRVRFDTGCRCDECTQAARAYHRANRKRRAALLAVDPDRVAHGLASTYTNHGCRCDECRKAAVAKLKKEAANRAARLAADPTIRPHGNRNTYTAWGCRCDECRAAAAAHERNRSRARKEAASW